jgi:DNA (cytosine-5)-methyltransferase 1
MMLSADFGCKETQEGDFRVRVRSGATTWRFDITAGKQTTTKRQPPFTIVLRANPCSPWVISSETVELRCWDKSWQVFTIAWKAFELELARLGIKADLVQLCEYYQYHPRLTASMKFGSAKPSRRWKILAKVVSGCGTRQILRVDQLSSAWEASQEEVCATVKWMRRIGYEVRNRNTNPQIPEGHFLIPYSFPTLTPMSVQLRKSLEG